MIIYLFGQPGAGKTTLGRELVKRIGGVHIDGDELRKLFSDQDYSSGGRWANVFRGMDIATYEQSKHRIVVVSMVCPFNDQRQSFSERNDVFWVYLTYDGDRGKDAFFVKDFDVPEGIEYLHINTSEAGVD